MYRKWTTLKGLKKTTCWKTIPETVYWKNVSGMFGEFYIIIFLNFEIASIKMSYIPKTGVLRLFKKKSGGSKLFSMYK